MSRLWNRDRKKEKPSEAKEDSLVYKVYARQMKDDVTPYSPPDPHHQFTIGSMVCVDVQRGDPLYGVVKWIGTLPDYPGTIAGVEMVISIMC